MGETILPSHKVLNKSEYLEECARHIKNVHDVEEVVVIIDGGAVGVEMASELKPCHPDKDIKLVHSHSEIPNGEPLPAVFRAAALDLLIVSGVEPILTERVVDYTPDTPEDKGFTVTLKSGKKLRAGKVIWAISYQRQTSTYLLPSALHPEGLVALTKHLFLLPAVPNVSSHFVAGDLAQWSGIKPCSAAMAHIGGEHASDNGCYGEGNAAEVGGEPGGASYDRVGCREDGCYVPCRRRPGWAGTTPGCVRR